MKPVNQAMLIGHLTRDPEDKGKGVVKFTVAQNFEYKKKDQDVVVKEVEFFGITCFGKLGEIVMKYCFKGQQVFVCGHLRHNVWTDKEGKEQRKLEIYADEVDFLSQKKDTQDVQEQDREY
jgi:single-strand DNA-binding protein